jgi:CPA2 family monovalent cation:H+ antiporter-2
MTPCRCATFAVLFFVSVGMLFDPMLVQQPLAVLATLAIIIFGKSAAAFFLVRMFGHSPRTALTIAASLAQIGEFAFILAGLGMALNLLPQAGQNLVLAGAIISIMLNPVLFTLLEKYLDKTETLDEQTLEEVLEDEKQVPVDICNHALLVGFGRVGSLLGEKLGQGIPLVVVETSRTRVDELRERGISAVLGNAANEEIMELAHLDCARWLLLTIPTATAGRLSLPHGKNARISRLSPAPIMTTMKTLSIAGQSGGDGRAGNCPRHAAASGNATGR